MEELNLPDSICRSVDVTDKYAMEKAIREAEEKYGQDRLPHQLRAIIMLLGSSVKQSYEEWAQDDRT